jgi:hypothetical protein
MEFDQLYFLVWYFTAGNLTLLAIYATATQATQAIQTTFTDKFNIFFLFIKVSLNLRSLLNGYYGVLYSRDVTLISQT